MSFIYGWFREHLEKRATWQAPICTKVRWTSVKSQVLLAGWAQPRSASEDKIIIFYSKGRVEVSFCNNSRLNMRNNHKNNYFVLRNIYY